jgi:hypothetical protein
VFEHDGNKGLNGRLTRTHQTVFTQTTHPSIWTGPLDPAQACMLEAVPYVQTSLPDSLVTISDVADDTALTAVVQIAPIAVNLQVIPPVNTYDMCPFVVGITENPAPAISLASTIIEKGDPVVLVASAAGNARIISTNGSLLRTDLKVTPGRNLFDATELVAGMYLLSFHGEAGRTDLKFIVR